MFEYYKYACLFLIILLIVFTAVIILNKKRLKALNEKNSFIEKILDSISNKKSLEENLMNILYAVSNIIQAPSYAFFCIDDKNEKFVLRAIRNASDNNVQIGPSYSGLSPYKKEAFFMPSTLPVDIIKDEAVLMKEGEVPLLLIPLQNNKSVILAGPVKSVDKKYFKLFNLLNEKTNSILDLLFELENLDEQVKVTLSSGRAVKNMSNIFADYRGMLDMILNLTINSISASGGMLIKNSNNKGEIETIIGLEKDSEEFLISDNNIYNLLSEFIDGKNNIFINKSNSKFFKLPPYFAAEDIQSILIIRLQTSNVNGMTVFWYKEDCEIKEYQMTVLEIMVKRMGDIIDNHLRFKQMSSSNIDILKMLAKLVDNLSASTVGYSELMYRYSVIIAKELKLDENEIKNIALAAYLSNIGIIGLSEDLFNKKGKYSEMEYEMMKLHSEVGASLIETTIANKEVAAIIRYHHERMDGLGYPEGLRGENIPVGARILAVVQTFLAKIQAREYRPALPFDQALRQLKYASNTQLDENVVGALTSWFNKRQNEKLNSGSTLGRCWEMRCSPENICAGCPAYKNYTINCWENKTNNCRNHGNQCETCFVRTEYLSRINKSKANMSI